MHHFLPKGNSILVLEGKNKKLQKDIGKGWGDV
jgi:hypothetical protein